QYGDGQLSIRDQGIGIPEEVLHRIGSPFNKSAAGALSQKGVGLGLAWVKTICDLYRWSYAFQTEKGTVFKVTFPPIISN
ncbi:MAG: ATP-binding protein, partial [Bdellovibrio sp.]